MQNWEKEFSKATVFYFFENLDNVKRTDDQMK